MKFTFKRANLVTWGEENVDFSDEEQNDKEALLYLMALDDDINEVYDSNLFCSSDDYEINDLYNKLYDSLVKAKKDLNKNYY